MKVYIIIILILFIPIAGCSGNLGEYITAPPQSSDAVSANCSTHCCLGLWRMTPDPATQSLDIVEMRAAAMHINVLPFLEPPPLVKLTLEYLKFVGTDEVIADIGLRHPFLGMTQFTGFDVCGVFISGGTSTFGDTGLIYAAGNDTHLMNPDGWTRWWNPDDFPQDGTTFNYKDGMLGTPDSTANFNTDLNPYKYYTDELDAQDDIMICTPAKRGQFSPGQKNIRRFDIHLGTQSLVFNYAVDACWEFPTGSKPWTAPDDFGENANRPEAWAIKVTEIENTLWNVGGESGGGLSLAVDVYDHFKANLNTIKVHSPGNFAPANSSAVIGGGDGYSTYKVDITNATPAPDSIPLYYIIESEQKGYGGKIPGAPISAYFTGSVDISTNQGSLTVLIPNGGEKWQSNTEYEITWASAGNVGPVKIEYSKDGFISDVHTIAPSTPNDGSFMWLIPFESCDTVRVRITDTTAPNVYDVSDNDFTIFMLETNIIHVDDDNVSGPWDGSKEHPFKLLGDAMKVAKNDCLIWVHPGKYDETGTISIPTFNNLTIYGEDSPHIHLPTFPGMGKAIINMNYSIGCTIDGLKFTQNNCYQSAIYIENTTDCAVRNCSLAKTLEYGFCEFLHAVNSTNLIVRGNNCDDFKNSATEMSIIYLTGCDNAVVTLNTCRRTIVNTGPLKIQTIDGFIYCANSNNVEISKNILSCLHHFIDSPNPIRLRCIQLFSGSGNIVRNNLIYDAYYYNTSSTMSPSNNTGIYASKCENIKIYNNTLDRIGCNDPGTGATYGIQLESCYTPTMYNNIISNMIATKSGTSYGVYTTMSAEQTYSDVWNLTGASIYRYGGLAVEGAGGINTNPMYSDPNNDLYILLPGSPCIGTGLDGHDMGCHGGTDPL